MRFSRRNRIKGKKTKRVFHVKHSLFVCPGTGRKKAMVYIIVDNGGITGHFPLYLVDANKRIMWYNYFEFL